MGEVLTTQELIVWCKSARGRMTRMAEKSGISVSSFREYFLDEKTPLTFDHDTSADFRKWMTEVEQCIGGNSLNNFPRRSVLFDWFNALNTRKSSYLAASKYSGVNPEIHCNPKHQYTSDIDDGLWFACRRLMRIVEKKERRQLEHCQNFNKWVDGSRGRWTAVAKSIGMGAQRLKRISTEECANKRISQCLDWVEIFQAVQSIQEQGYSVELIETNKKTLIRRFTLWTWLRKSPGRSPAVAEITGCFCSNLNKHPSKYKHDYTDRRWKTLTGAMVQIEDYEKQQVVLSVLFNMWFWCRSGRTKDLRRVTNINEKTIIRYRNLTFKNHLRSLQMDWKFLIKGMQQAQIYEQAKTKKKDYRAISETDQASKKRKAA